MAPATTWAVVVPVKRLDRAKTRLEVDPAERAALALSFAADTVAAALRASGVGRVVVVTDDPSAAAEMRGLGAVVVPDVPDAGLNPALSYAAQLATAELAGAAVAALSADLPALRSVELAAALAAAEAHDSSFLVDVVGTGTTLLTARDRSRFAPAFGPDSAARHAAAGSAPLPTAGLDSVRLDVDTAADLEAARRLGLGPRTGEVLRRRTTSRRS